MVCQDRDPAAAGPRRAGRDVHNPDIGRLLPVYVADHYDGFEAKTFLELQRRGGRAPTSTRNVAAVRAVAGAVAPDVALANHAVMGPAILARALGRRRALRGQDPRQRAGVRRQGRPGALRALRRARAWRAPAAVLVGSLHTAESLWAALEGLDAARRARAWGRRASTSTQFRPAPAARRCARLAALAERLQAMPHSAEAGSLRPRRGRRRPRAGGAGSRRRPARGVRRQADRLQGRRPARRRLAARARSACPTRGWSSSASARSARASSACSPRWPAATSTRCARSPRAGPRGRGRPRRGAWRCSRRSWTRSRTGDRDAYLAAAAAAARARDGRRAPRPRRAGRPAAAVRGPGGAEHLPGGVRDGRRRGGGLRRAAGQRRALRVWRRSARVLAGAVPEPARDLLAFALGPDAVRDLAARLIGWLGADEALRSADARRPGGDGPRPLVVGGRRGGRPGRGAGAISKGSCRPRDR